MTGSHAFPVHRRLPATSSTHRPGPRSAEVEALGSLPDTEISEALPEDFRMAVYYADVEGFAYKEIAQIMDTPIGTVMSRRIPGRVPGQTTVAQRAGRCGHRTRRWSRTTPDRDPSFKRALCATRNAPGCGNCRARGPRGGRGDTPPRPNHRQANNGHRKSS
jgi:hypothetical protein